MDETDTDVVISVDCFNTICRICLRDLKQTKAVNINSCLYENIEEVSPEKGALIIKDILSRCTTIEVSKELLH